jgi:hypothetical protein
MEFFSTSMIVTSVVGCAVGCVAGLALAMAGVVLLPADFFLPHEHVRPSMGRRVGRILKNLLGVVLVVLGVILLVLPGQGLLTIVVGLMLVDFPGKHALVARLLARPHLLPVANRWRARFGRPPLAAPQPATR